VATADSSPLRAGVVFGDHGYAVSMFPRLPRPSRLHAAAPLALSLALLGCGPNPATSGSPSGPGSSGTAACATAPAPAADLPGWGMPAQPPEISPFIINGPGEVTCGQNRILFTLVDSSNTPVGAPDRTASIAFYNLGRDPSNPIASVDGTFVWAIKDQRGIYVANASFPEAGVYGAELTTAKGSEQPVKLRTTFDVQPSSQVIGVGDKAPASKTPTLADADGDPSKISTDPDPDPAFYETSVDQAIAKHEPFVVIFATPKFCTSLQCGPTMDSIKPFVAKYPTVTFIHVEPYKLKLVDGTLRADLDATNRLQATAITDGDWHLLSEPVVYVVDRTGVVTARFDLIFSDAELTAALDAVK
jgi:hypothetical protein